MTSAPAIAPSRSGGRAHRERGPSAAPAVARCGANASRDAVRERIAEVLEAELGGGATTAQATTADGVEAVAVAVDTDLGPAPADTIRVRRRRVGGADVVFVGRASSVMLGESLRATPQGLWTAVPIAVAVTVVLAAAATARTLRPVADITRLAARVGAGDAAQRVPVPETTDEIESLARRVNDMLDRIAAVVAAQRQFSADAAHALRTPLMALAAEIELARRPDASPDAALLGRLEALTARLAARVDDGRGR